MKILTEKQISYHAAAIDGEGSIDIIRDKRDYYHLHVAIGNTDISFLLYLKQTTEIGKIYNSHKETIKHKNGYKWILRNYEMKEYLSTIINDLIVRKKQAEILLEFLSTLKYKNSKWSPIPIEIQALRELLWEEIRILNKRGPKTP